MDVFYTSMNMLDTFFLYLGQSSTVFQKMGQRPSWGLCVMPIRNPEGLASPHPSAKWFRPKLSQSGLLLVKEKNSFMRMLLFSMLSMEMNLSSTCWGWMDHFWGASCFYGICKPSPPEPFRHWPPKSFWLTAFSWGPSGSQGKVGNTMSFKSPTKAWHTNFHTKVVTPSIIIPAKTTVYSFHANMLRFTPLSPLTQRIPNDSCRSCFGGCSFFVWWSGFHWQKRMLGFPRKELAIYRGVGGLQDHTLWYEIWIDSKLMIVKDFFRM